ncbi:MAG TPA: pilus assembly protein TadG-related protein [Rhizomicrobium sp.]|nr:pilus assembly protein TadG-related protein [Rhizomicrobium sp.]
MFALSALPLIFALGAGLDYARVLVVRTELTNALDEAALAIASGGYDPADAKSVTAAKLRAESFFKANYDDEGLTKGGHSTITIQKVGDALTLSTTAVVPTTLMEIAGIPSVTVDATSTAIAGQPKMWVSFVLDNTNSMCASDTDPDSNGPCADETGTKLSFLKSAMHQVLDQIKAVAGDSEGGVLVSIVPFSRVVNIGTSNVGESWIGWPPSKLTPASDHSSWRGCVTDRGSSKAPAASSDGYDVTNALPVSGDSLFPAYESQTLCPVSMLPLTDDWTALGNTIDAMVPSGATNQTIGVVWGWQLMTEKFPFPTGGQPAVPALPPGTQRIIVLFSDGVNTTNRWTTDSPLIDARMALVCKNAKADGVTIYAVYVHIGKDSPASVLRDCASTGHYYDETSAKGITDAFKAIGDPIATPHLAH